MLRGAPAAGHPTRRAGIGLIHEAVPFDDSESTVSNRAEQLAALPGSQLAARKLIVNQAYENMGLASTQTLGPILDGLMRNTPEVLRFIEGAADEGVGAFVADRDAPFGDYGVANPADEPDPAHVIHPWRTQPRVASARLPCPSPSCRFRGDPDAAAS